MGDIIQVQKKQDPIKGMIPMVGQAIGGIFGGPAGAMAGGAVGGAVANSGNKGPAPSVSSPVDRRMESMQQDPLNQLKEGKNALSLADEQTRQSLEPVLDEAIKKAAMQKQQMSPGAY